MLDTVRGTHVVEVTHVEWAITASGQIIQYPHFKTLEQNGIQLSTIPIYDARNFEERGCGIGAKIKITNGTFVKVVQPNDLENNSIRVCPYCGSQLEYQPDTPNKGRLTCYNPYCEGSLAKLVAYYAGHIGIPITEKLAPYVVKALPHKALYDLYDMKYEDWLNADLYGEYKIDEIMDGIEYSRTNTDLESFLFALSIPFVTIDSAHEIAKRVDGSWDRFIQCIIHEYQWEGFDCVGGVNWSLKDWFRNRKCLTDLLAERIDFRPYAWDIEDIINKRFRIFGDTRFFTSPIELRKDMISLGAEVPKPQDEEEPNCIVSNLIWCPESSAADELYHYCLYHPYIQVMDELEYLERTRLLREGFTR